MGCKKRYMPIYTCQHCSRYGLFNKDCTFGDFVLRGVSNDGTRIFECRHLSMVNGRCSSMEAMAEADRQEAPHD
jgi:hypothetical protein